MLTFRLAPVTSLRQQLFRTSWLCAFSFAVGALVPCCLGLLFGPRMDLAAPLAAIAAGLFASFALTRWDSNFAWRTVVVALACTLMPAASCAGTVALGLSPLEPLRFGLHRFDATAWRKPRVDERQVSERAAMVAHLTLGGLLNGKGKSEVRAMLGTPDCGSHEAWYLGFSSTAIDPDCLHVEYGPHGLVTRAYVQTH